MGTLSAAWREADGIHYLQAGEAESPRAAVILLHGRGGSAADILSLAPLLDAADVLFLAPEARGNTWYPYSFLAPMEQNEPSLGTALASVQRIVSIAMDAVGGSERVVLGGFSQGACLALESAVRYPRAYGGVLALSGGLIGPPGTVWNDEGSFGGAPIFLGCSDIDPHIPLGRVRESSGHLRGMGASVTERIYPGMGHTINDDEVEAFRQIVATI